MKLKKTHSFYLLIPLNIVVWTYFIFEFSELFSANEQIVGVSSVLKKDAITDTTNYHLILNYQDPFLGDVKTPVAHRRGNSLPVIKTVKANVVPIAAAGPTVPAVRYIGVIRNRTTGVVAGLISIAGQSKVVRPKERIEGIEFRSFLQDSMICSFHNRLLVVKK